MLRKYIKIIKQLWRKTYLSTDVPERTRDEYDFQPGYLEIVERPAAPWAKRTALAITSLLIIALCWSIFGQLDIQANATGKLIVSSHSKVIQSLEAGEIMAIHVQDGQKVKSGDVLISLNPIGVDAEKKEIEEQLNFRRLEKARLLALLSNDPLHNWVIPEGVSSNKATEAHEYLVSEWNEVVANLKDIDSEMQVNQSNQQARHSDIAALNKLAMNIRQRLTAYQALLDKKIVPKVEFMTQEKERLDVERSLAQQNAELAVLKALFQRLKEQRETFLVKVQREYHDKLNDARINIASLEQRLIKIDEKQRLQTLRAPVSGVVQQLAVHTLGGVVQTAQQLMVIVPENVGLDAEVLVLNKDVGFVRAGQEVEIKVDSFPYTRYGTIIGKVVHVSRDAVKDEQQGLAFPAKIKMERAFITVDDNKTPLQAGMSVVAEIRTGKRRVIDYLLSPLQQYQSEAMKER
jgi:RTX toxin transport system membrane fusion protein